MTRTASSFDGSCALLAPLSVSSRDDLRRCESWTRLWSALTAVDDHTHAACTSATLTRVDEPEVVRRRELRDSGWDDSLIARRLLSGRLIRVDRDRYVLPGIPATVEQIVARPGTATALSHASAARAWGLPASDPRLHVVVPHGCRRRTPGAAAAVVHQTRSWQAVVRDGVAVTEPVRTVADLLRSADLVEAVAVTDAALRVALVDRSAVATALREPVRAHLRARQGLALSDGRAESPLESQLRLLLGLAGLAPDDLQHEVRERGRFVARVDLWYDAGLVVEADGYEFHRERSDYVADRRKAQAFSRLGLSLLRFSWEDVQTRPGMVVATVGTVLARHDRAA